MSFIQYKYYERGIFMENIRERLLMAEKENLSPFAQLAAETKGRKRQEEECTLRTCYQKDRDKILHSKSFRRLKQKKQVFMYMCLLRR